MSRIRSLSVFAGACALVAASFAAPAPAQQPAPRTPLLIEGKKTLHQRVLTRPGAVPHAAPGARPAAAALPPMTALYVYERRVEGGKTWLEVGPAGGRTTGWLDAADTVEWRQQLSLAFTNPANRDRALFFRDRADLQKLLEAGDRAEQAAALRRTVEGGAIPERFPVVSIEPATHIDIAKQFYLLPILEAQETYTAQGLPARALRVASVTLRRGADDPLAPKQRQNQGDDEALKGFSAGIVFVIDTTTSMEPYIARTREAVQKVYDAIDKAGLRDKVRFGLVAYRNSVQRTPGIEYVSRLYADPSKTPDAQAFLAQVRGLSATSISSHSFAEDAMAGLVTAIEDVKWDGFAARYLVLVTDAGGLAANDPASKTGLGVEQVRRMALDKGMAIYALHLQTPAGVSDHASARAQYRALTAHPNVAQPLYYPVESGSVAQFGATVDALAQGIVAQVQDAAGGKIAAGAAPQNRPQPPQGAPGAAPRIADDARLVGRAMMLAYLGREKGVAAPRMFEAWASDRDLGDAVTPALEVRVLLSKTQLSDLQETLKRIVEAGKRGQLSPQGFFDQLRSAAAAMSRDPSRVGRGQAARLGELGLMGEYLDDLPYRSKIMSVDQDLWSSWSITQQQQFIDEIEAKIRLYQRYHDDVGRWVSLDGANTPGEAVYPVPLEALP